MGKPISEEQKQKIIEAHKLKLSITGAAKHAGVSRDSIITYWKAAGLKSHFLFAGVPISKEKQDLIYTAWKFGLSANKAAVCLCVSWRNVLKYWRKFGLEQPHKTYYYGSGAPIKVSLTNLLDDVFNTATNPDERLELEQIVGRLEDWLGTEKINLKDLQEKISQLVGWGYYAIVQEGGKTYYKAGMPSAMDGMVKKELVAK